VLCQQAYPVAVPAAPGVTNRTVRPGPGESITGALARTRASSRPEGTSSSLPGPIGFGGERGMVREMGQPDQEPVPRSRPAAPDDLGGLGAAGGAAADPGR